MGSVLSHIFETGKQRISRNDCPFSSFVDLARSIMTALPTLSPQFLAYFAVAAESRL